MAFAVALVVAVAFAFLSVILAGDLLLAPATNDPPGQTQIGRARLQPCRNHHRSTRALAPEVLIAMSSGQEPKQQDNSAARFDRWNDPEGWSLVRGPVSDEGWTSAGRFDFSGHGDFWNSLPNEPGVYRLKFSENLYYVGQAKSISRRLGDYYQPGQGIESDHRIHRALRKFNGADVQVMTGDQFNNPTIRRQKENAEIDALRQIAGVRVLNGDCIENLQDRIEYHQDEIEKLKKKISDLTKNSEVIENV